MIIPSKINKGDEVILIAPSRKVDLSALEITEEWLKKQDLVPLRGEHILKEEGIFAGISCGAAACIASKLSFDKDFEGKTIVVILPDAGERYLSSSLFDY